MVHLRAVVRYLELAAGAVAHVLAALAIVAEVAAEAPPGAAAFVLDAEAALDVAFALDAAAIVAFAAFVAAVATGPVAEAAAVATAAAVAFVASAAAVEVVVAVLAQPGTPLAADDVAAREFGTAVDVADGGDYSHPPEERALHSFQSTSHFLYAVELQLQNCGKECYTVNTASLVS